MPTRVRNRVGRSMPPLMALSASNLLGLDYRAEAARLGPPVCPIIDVHTHIHGASAARVYEEARRVYGVVRTYSMSPLAQAESLRGVLGDSLRFIATPDFGAGDRRQALGPGFIEAIDRWHALGARMVKFWCAPRGRDLGREAGDWTLYTLLNPWRRRQMDRAASLGMMFMVHVADPDTWFRTRYADRSLYGEKREHYEPLEALMRDYRGVPWLLAHMGGWPEDLDFLDGLLERHPNAHLDTSATKWMVRELSRHPRGRVLAFHERWRGRVLFGSDIVTNDAHIGGEGTPGPPSGDARTPAQAFDLYASRYWALRTQYETAHEGPSPIADPDLMLTDPERFTALSSPVLRGHALPPGLLRTLYHDAAAALVDAWYERPGNG
jgi:hypothetical protein